MSTVYGPKWPFLLMLCIILDCLGHVCSWVELPVQRRLCPIFVRDVGSPDIDECFCGLMGSQWTPGFWGVTVLTNIEIIPRSRHNLILTEYLSYGVLIGGLQS